MRERLGESTAGMEEIIADGGEDLLDEEEQEDDGIDAAMEVIGNEDVNSFSPEMQDALGLFTSEDVAAFSNHVLQQENGAMHDAQASVSHQQQQQQQWHSLFCHCFSLFLLISALLSLVNSTECFFVYDLPIILRFFFVLLE